LYVLDQPCFVSGIQIKCLQVIEAVGDYDLCRRARFCVGQLNAIIATFGEQS